MASPSEAATPASIDEPVTGHEEVCQGLRHRSVWTIASSTEIEPCRSGRSDARVARLPERGHPASFDEPVHRPRGGLQGTSASDCLNDHQQYRDRTM